MHLIVLTMDRRGSRTHEDDVDATRARLEARWGSGLRSPIARFAGDELQLASTDPATIVGIVLELTRTRAWSIGVGLGAGTISQDPAASTGPAFYAARRAVDRAKHAPTRVAVEAEEPSDGADGAGGPGVLEAGAADLEAVAGLLVALRDRRTREGWEVADLLERHATQREVAELLGVSASAVSARAIAAGIRVESAGVATVVGMVRRLLERSHA